MILKGHFVFIAKQDKKYDELMTQLSFTAEELLLVIPKKQKEPLKIKEEVISSDSEIQVIKQVQSNSAKRGTKRKQPETPIIHTPVKNIKRQRVAPAKESPLTNQKEPSSTNSKVRSQQKHDKSKSTPRKEVKCQVKEEQKVTEQQNSSMSQITTQVSKKKLSPSNNEFKEPLPMKNESFKIQIKLENKETEKDYEIFQDRPEAIQMLKKYEQMSSNIYNTERDSEFYRKSHKYLTKVERQGKLSKFSLLWRPVEDVEKLIPSWASDDKIVKEIDDLHQELIREGKLKVSVFPNKKLIDQTIKIYKELLQQQQLQKQNIQRRC